MSDNDGYTKEFIFLAFLQILLNSILFFDPLGVDIKWFQFLVLILWNLSCLLVWGSILQEGKEKQNVR